MQRFDSKALEMQEQMEEMKRDAEEKLRQLSKKNA